MPNEPTVWELIARSGFLALLIFVLGGCCYIIWDFLKGGDDEQKQ